MNALVTIDQFREDQTGFMNELIESKGANLPVNIGQVLEVFEFTNFKAKAFKAMSDGLKNLTDHQETYHTALRSGQNWGIAALYAQKRMGEITREMPTAESQSNYPVEQRSVSGKITTLSDHGITKRTYADAEIIANNPEILDRVIESSKERGEIPTKTAVLNTIKVERHHKKETERKIKVDNKSYIPQEISAVVLQNLK